MGKGFFEDLLNSILLNAAVQSSKNRKGKPDPYAAAGIAHGMKGDLSDSDMAELGALLGAQGAFDDDMGDDDDHCFDTDDTFGDTPLLDDEQEDDSNGQADDGLEDEDLEDEDSEDEDSEDEDSEDEDEDSEDEDSEDEDSEDEDLEDDDLEDDECDGISSTEHENALFLRAMRSPINEYVDSIWQIAQEDDAFDEMKKYAFVCLQIMEHVSRELQPIAFERVSEKLAKHNMTLEKLALYVNLHNLER